MEPVLTADEYRRVDTAYEGDLDMAMDRAGHAVALAATRAGAGYGRRVAVLAGSGNNGGDGYVAASYLAGRGAQVTVHALADPKTGEARRAADRARATGVVIRPLGEPSREHLVIDALFGGGARPGIPGAVVPWLDVDAPVIAVDYPTGLDPNTGKVADRAFRAVETVTFGTLKTGHLLGKGPDHCGRLTVADIGISGGTPSMYLMTGEDVVTPPRTRTTHKWDVGSVLVVGGSSGMTGAAVLAAKGALSYGAGAVAIATPDRGAVVSNTVEFPTFPLEGALPDLDRFDVVVFGPGLAEEDFGLAFPLLEKSQRAVIDAGGLRAEVSDLLAGAGPPSILTPHSREFSRIAGVSGGTYAVRALAEKLGSVVLLKGNPTRISDGGPPVVVNTGGPELATIGTGDVLSGMIAALWARGARPLEAAATAAYHHGIAGADLAADRPLTASDLARHVARYAW